MASHPSPHQFQSPKFISVVAEAIEFFGGTPSYTLPHEARFMGAGVYGLYYVGDYGPYAKLGERNRTHLDFPIYVGKAVPPGWRMGRRIEQTTAALFGRIREHVRSIEQGKNLQASDFHVRYMILGDTESDLVVPVEAALIRTYLPLWNCFIDGFGNHDPGKGRYNQAPSEWDVLHPGRGWAERLTGAPPNRKAIKQKLQQHFATWKPS